MNQSQVFDAIRELLPKVTKEAIISWADFIADMNFGDPIKSDGLRSGKL